MNPPELKLIQTDATVDLLNESTNQSDPVQPTTNSDPAASAVRIPVIEEQVHVGTRLVETGRVRLVKTVHQDEQAVDVPLMQEDILIERVPMDQVVDNVPPTRQEGDTTIYPVLKEEFVLQKRLRLIEEIRVTKQQVQTSQTQTITLRREVIDIDRSTATPPLERPDLPGPDWVGKSPL